MIAHIALHKADKTNFPSLPLMKLSAWHKRQGHKVSSFMPLMEQQYDIIYSSKVFSFTQPDPYLPKRTIKGGTGYGSKENLSDEIEHITPDYTVYPNFSASIGFVTRGCIRNCPWCIVPEKEGSIYAHAEISEFLRPDSRDVVLLDNNILAHEHGIKQIEWCIEQNLRIDCNQGLDARIIAGDKCIARLLSRVHWMKSIRLACDNKSQMDAVKKAVISIRNAGNKQYNFSCYVLVKDIDDALERVEFLRKLKVDPFAQPYRDFNNNKDPNIEQRRFARYVNHKAIFKSVSWKQYVANKQNKHLMPLTNTDACIHSCVR